MPSSSRISLRFALGVLGLLVATALTLLLIFRAQPVWIVEDRFIAAWETAIADSPLRGAKIIPLSAAVKERRSWYGYRIATAPPENGAGEGPVRVYRGLRNDRRQGESLLLALDPWLVFRRFTSPVMSREDAENGPAGQIYLAGSEAAAIRAWTAQLMQESPGVFSADRELWKQTEERLLDSGMFQSGSRDHGWEDILPHLTVEGAAVWIYAPFSKIRLLAEHETNSLEAGAFPGRPGWNQAGLQAELLWAKPFGRPGNRKKLEAAQAWLQGVSMQSLLADTLGWAAAHPEYSPFNRISVSARNAWRGSSYLWINNPTLPPQN